MNYIFSNNLSESSIKLYTKLLNKIVNDLKIKNINEFNKFDIVKNYLDKNYSNLSTYKSYLNAIININDDNKYKLLRDEIQKKNDLLKGDNYQDENKNISYKDLKNIINFNIEPKDKLDELKLYSNEMLLYFAIMFPLRLDYYNIELVYPKEEPTQDNYMMIKNKYIELHLKDYKTKNIYGEFKNRFDNKTLKIVQQYIRLYEDVYNEKPKKLFYFKSTTMYARQLQNLLLDRTKLKLTNNDIRHIYETDFIKSPMYKYLTNNQKEAYSNKILHSHNEALKSYNKV
jgi:hypothetical protein